MMIYLRILSHAWGRLYTRTWDVEFQIILIISDDDVALFNERFTETQFPA